MPNLTTAQIGGLTTAELAGFTAAQTPLFTTAQIAALTTAQVAALAATQVAVLTTQELAGFSTVQLSVLTTAAISGIQPGLIVGLSTASKDRTSIFDKRDPFVIDESTGKELKEWAELGVDPAEEAAKKKAEKEAEESAQNILKEKKKIVDMSIKLGFVVPTDKTQNIPALTAFIKATTNDDYRSDLPLEGLVDIAEHLSFTFNERAESAQGTLEI